MHECKFSQLFIAGNHSSLCRIINQSPKGKYMLYISVSFHTSSICTAGSLGSILVNTAVLWAQGRVRVLLQMEKKMGGVK